MKLRWLSSILILFLSAALGCSNQWRETEEIEPTDLAAALEEAHEAVAQGFSGGSVSDVLLMADEGETDIYFAFGPSQLGPAASIASLWDFSAFGFSAGTFNFLDLQNVRVFFFDQVKDGVRRFGLAVGVQLIGEEGIEYRGFIGNGSIDGDELVVQMTGANGEKIVLRSFDTDGDRLQQVIQLRVYQNINGVEHYVGKFSTLYGFVQ